MKLKYIIKYLQLFTVNRETFIYQNWAFWIFYDIYCFILDTNIISKKCSFDTELYQLKRKNLVFKYIWFYFLFVAMLDVGVI